MPVCIFNCVKKNARTLYLTVEQVRQAASVWTQVQDMPASVRWRQYQKTAAQIAYYQRRNQQARRSHTQTAHRRLRRIGIRLDQLRSCVPEDS